jgi:hypothetical protein
MKERMMTDPISEKDLEGKWCRYCDCETEEVTGDRLVIKIFSDGIFKPKAFSQQINAIVKSRTFISRTPVSINNRYTINWRYLKFQSRGFGVSEFDIAS